jgi:hypothetical protein
LAFALNDPRFKIAVLRQAGRDEILAEARVVERGLFPTPPRSGEEHHEEQG